MINLMQSSMGKPIHIFLHDFLFFEICSKLLHTAAIRLAVLGHRLEFDATLAYSRTITRKQQLDSCTENLCCQSRHESKILHQGSFHSADNSSSRATLLSYIILPQLIALKPKLIFIFKIKTNPLQHTCLLTLF